MSIRSRITRADFSGRGGLLLVVGALCVALRFVTGCQSTSLPMTQLQVRQMQTREYGIRQPTRALKAVLNVLQDEGFIPRQVDGDVGYIYAVKEVDVEDPGDRFWANFWHGRRDARWRKNSIIECAANVSGRSAGVRVRLTFQVKIVDNTGRTQSVVTVLDPRIYQDFFSRVGKGVFLEKSGV